jgi:nucleotide-binding universal stress UspA family protein
MENAKNVLLVLKSRDMGKPVLQYFEDISAVLRPNHLYFMVIKPYYDFPKSILKQFPKIEQSLSKESKSKIKDTIGSFFISFLKIKLHFIFSQENIMQDIMKTVRIRDIDLLVMEKEYPELGPHSFSEKIIRKVTCSTLIITANAQSKPKNVLVPVDFSQNAVEALKFALTFTKFLQFKNIFCLHFYTIPFMLSHTGIDLERFHQIMEENSADEFQDFLRQFSDSKKCIVPLLEPNTDPMSKLKDIIASSKIDLIIMANRGKGSTPVMLGSLTEAVINSVKIPTLILKNKKLNISRLYALYRSLGLK